MALIIKQLWRSVASWLTLPVDSSSIGRFRVCFGVAALVWCVLLAPSIRTFYGDNGLFSVQDWKGYSAGQAPTFLADSTSPNLAAFTLLVASCASICVILGAYSRLASIAVYVCMLALYNRGIVLMEGEDHVLICLAFLMIFVPSGCAVSLDRWALVAKDKPVAPQTIVAPSFRLVQLQVALIYFDACLGKLQGPTWIDGSAVYTVLHMARWHNISLPGADWMVTSTLLSYFTLATEGLLSVCLWLRSWRAWIVAAGVILHLGMAWCMDLGPFPLVMICALSALCSSSDYRRLRWLIWKGREYLRFFGWSSWRCFRLGGLRAVVRLVTLRGNLATKGMI